MTVFNRLKHGVDVTKFKADQLLKINRVRGEIDVLLQDIAQHQKKIALKAIELHQAGVLSNPELDQLCLGIDDINQLIRQKEAQIAAIRAEEAPQYIPPPIGVVQNPCSTCGFDVPISASFCPNCGKTVIPPQPTTTSEIDSESICQNCGNSIHKGVVFCPQCGQKIGKPDTNQLE